MTTENTPVGLDVRALSVAYGAHTVLKDVDLAIPPGASLAIVGESGCGKTTLLTTVAGLMSVAGGSVDWKDAAGNAKTKIRSSFVWQNLGLFPWKTVEENLTLPFELKNASIGRQAGKVKAQEMIAELGLTGLEKRWPDELSGGQRQRLALGRALIADPEVLFMDEPFSALDALRRERLQDFLADMRKTRDVTMVFVTHDIAEAVFLSSHILLLAANPSRVLELYVNPAWRENQKCADRESDAFFQAVRHVHSALRAAAKSSSATAGQGD